MMQLQARIGYSCSLCFLDLIVSLPHNPHSQLSCVMYKFFLILYKVWLTFSTFQKGDGFVDDDEKLQKIIDSIKSAL